MDPGGEVLKVVAAVVTGFQTAADTLEQIKERKERKKRRKEREVEELMEIKILHKSLVEGGARCRRHCDSRHQQFSPEFEAGDAIALPALKDVVIALQSEIIQALHMARAVENAVLDLTTLHESSITCCKDATRAMDQLCQRITASLQLQQQHLQQPDGGHAVSALSPSNASMRSVATSVQPPEFDKTFEVMSHAHMSGMGAPNGNMYQRALPPLPQRTATIRRPSDTISQMSRFTVNRAPPQYQSAQPSPPAWPPPTMQATSRLPPASLARPEPSVRSFTIATQDPPPQSFALTAEDLSRQSFAIESEPSPSSLVIAAEDPPRRSFQITPELPQTAIFTVSQSQPAGQSFAIMSADPGTISADQDGTRRRSSVSSIQDSVFALGSVNGSQRLHPVRAVSNSSHGQSISDVTSSDQSRQSSQREPAIAEDPPLTPASDITIPHEQVAKQVFIVHSEGSRPPSRPQSSKGLQQNKQQHADPPPLPSQYRQDTQQSMVSMLSDDERVEHAHPNQPQYATHWQIMASPVQNMVSLASPPPHRQIEERRPPKESYQISEPDDDISLAPSSQQTIEPRPLFVQHEQPPYLSRAEKAPEVMKNDLEYSEKVVQRRSFEDYKMPAYLSKDDYVDRLEALRPGKESIWLPLARPAMHNRYHGFCKGAWQIRRRVQDGLDITVTPPLDKPTLHWTCKSCKFTAKAPNPDALPDQIHMYQRFNVRYRWLFLAKSHQSATSALSDPMDYALGCLFCAAQGQPSASYEKLDHLMVHIVSKHKTSMMTPEIKAKTKCMVGGVAKADEDWDISFPSAVQKGAGVAADELMIGVGKFFGRRRKKG
ncbi:hypothetical protein LTR95_006114 [Oleoguttula sp. CCFEE 5521]